MISPRQVSPLSIFPLSRRVLCPMSLLDGSTMLLSLENLLPGEPSPVVQHCPRPLPKSLCATAFRGPFISLIDLKSPNLPEISFLIFSFFLNLMHNHNLCHQLYAYMLTTLHFYLKDRSLSGFLGKCASQLVNRNLSLVIISIPQTRI